jgi:hypothetical protein
MRRELWIALAVALAGCAGNGEGLDENGRPVDTGPQPLTATFASIQENVFTPICTRCHAGAAAPAGLRLDEASSYAMLVNTPSVEVPGLRRVRPGDPDLSYLVQKVEGRAAVGARMPLNAPPLSQAMIDVIRQWISEGAQPTVSLAPPGRTKLTAVAPLDAEILSAPPAEILLSASAALDTTALHDGTVNLMRSGGDGSFAEGNEVALTPSSFEIRSADPTVIAIKLLDNRWPTDSYQLSVAGTGAVAITDRSGAPLDGDSDGRPGGDFVMYFELGESL